MEWVHCNNCYNKYENSLSFWLTQCGHLYCQGCLEKNRNTKQCVVCKKIYGGAIELSKTMDYSMQMFFMPFESMQKKIMEIYTFQNQQRTRLMQILMYKYNLAKKECLNATNMVHKLQEENKMLRSKLNSSSGGRSNFSMQFATSTPLDQNVMTPNYNQSIVSSIKRNNMMPNPLNLSMHSKGTLNMTQNRIQIFSSGSSAGTRRVPIHNQYHRSGAPMDRFGLKRRQP